MKWKKRRRPEVQKAQFGGFVGHEPKGGGVETETGKRVRVSPYPLHTVLLHDVDMGPDMGTDMAADLGTDLGTDMGARRRLRIL
eukprot:3324060-Rhodomonas_salina.2